MWRPLETVKHMITRCHWCFSITFSERSEHNLLLDFTPDTLFSLCGCCCIQWCVRKRPSIHLFVEHLLCVRQWPGARDSLVNKSEAVAGLMELLKSGEDSSSCSRSTGRAGLYTKLSCLRGCIYMEFRKMVTITLCTRQQKRHWCIEQSYGLCWRGRGWEDLGERHWNM